MMKNDNIAAISTAAGAAGVAVIRISGKDSLSVAEKAFRPAGKIAVTDFIPNMMYAGEIDAGEFTDFGLCVYFKAPRSFTGEDTVEFHSHGGTAIAQGILKRVLSLGARLAEHGEFTRRAFLNGKLSLASAEGLIDMINAESVAGVKAGYSLYREKLTADVTAMQNELTAALSQIDADMDFPEEGLEETSRAAVKSALGRTVERTDKLLATFRSGSRVKNGVKVGIVGKPNTGKSSLLNALLGFDKAIVSDVPGTTRDIVEGSLTINGVKFLFSDTAGIRDSADRIESFGVALSKKVLDESDILLFVVGAGELGQEDEAVYSLVKDKNVLFAVNKTDKSDYKDPRADIYLSAKTGENLEELKAALYNRTVGTVDLNGDFLCEERHFDALTRAKEHLVSALGAADDAPLDILAVDITSGWQALGEISGKTASEDIIDDIFSRFCVGK